MSEAKPKKRTRVERVVAERVERLIGATSRTYGELEALAGVTDRAAFWAGKSEEEARAELRELIAGRVRRGELKGAA